MKDRARGGSGAKQRPAASRIGKDDGVKGEVLKTDLGVIGAGAAGLSVAAVAAAFGVPVVLVEKGRMGGECLNSGCVPSKALLAAAHVAETFRRATPFGIAGAQPRVDPARVLEHLRGVIAGIAPTDSAERFTAMGVRVIRGEARFTDGRTLAVNGTSIRARRFVVATGSRPAIPEIPGLAGTPYLTNETIFDLAVRPERLVIIGGGPVAVEIAQAWRRLGAEVTVLARGRILPRLDPEIAGHAIAVLGREGIALREAVTVASVAHGPAGFRLETSAGPVEASHLLVATGRQAVTDGLGLAEAGVASDRTGILVDDGLRTSNRRIYAIGDCVGGRHADRFTHVAAHHASVVIRGALFRVAAKVERATIPRTVFTDPEIATVGLSEAEARAGRRPVRILRWPFAENDRARADRLTEGGIKVVATAKGLVLGAAIVGARASDLIVPWTLAVKKEMNVADFRDLVVAYPTYSEVSRRAAVSFFAEETRQPAVARLLRVLRLFG